MRYKTNKIQKDKIIRYYKPRIIPNIPIKDTDIFIYPLYGDRFDTLANRYYEDSNSWIILRPMKLVMEKSLQILKRNLEYQQR